MNGMEWADRAKCLSADPSIFFPAVGEPDRAAKAVCASCDVQVECREFAMGNPGLAPYGVWGGLGERERGRARGRRRPDHGTLRRYDEDGCRCSLCGAADRFRQAEAEWKAA